VRLDDDNDDVLVDAYTLEHVLGLPAVRRRRAHPDYEQSLRGSFRDRSADRGTADSASLTGVGGAGLAGVRGRGRGGRGGRVARRRAPTSTTTSCSTTTARSPDAVSA
jgi:hypothetical protein